MRVFMTLSYAPDKSKKLPICDLSLFAGLHPTEITRLTWNRIDLSESMRDGVIHDAGCAWIN
jgi:hypothetical protein